MPYHRLKTCILKKYVYKNGERLLSFFMVPEVLWQKHSQRFTEIVRNNEGVWLSAKLFYIVGSLSLLSIITIVLEIAFYVYFHWIQ